ncbi:MAG: cell division ATP-binding protein FtsE [Acidobacteriota bacterium]|nr:cell division ATP-binding protein FtsE [Acidobacteriota bacterium]MDH3786751.1 cell division ATP-binding protein FtsE [Acidobacteriota bacterium]
MIRLHNVHKRFSGEVAALGGVTLEVEKGEFVFVTGPSGAGKTTLLRLLLRQQRPSEGNIFVAGRNVGALPDRKIPELRRSMGVVFQDFKLIARKNALENVAYVLNVAGHSRAEQRRRAYNALRSVGLNHRLNVYPRALSGGEQQRVAIARAIVCEPDILLADEPTGNLDPDLAVETMRLFREINARGTTVVVATHDRDLIRRMQRRTIILDGGRVVDVDRTG